MLVVGLNLYGRAENGVDERDPWIIQENDRLSLVKSNVPGVSAELMTTMTTIRKKVDDVIALSLVG